MWTKIVLPNKYEQVVPFIAAFASSEEAKNLIPASRPLRANPDDPDDLFSALDAEKLFLRGWRKKENIRKKVRSALS